MDDYKAVREYSIFEAEADITFGLRIQHETQVLTLDGDLVGIVAGTADRRMDCDVAQAHGLYLMLHEMFKSLEAFNPDLLYEALDRLRLKPRAPEWGNAVKTVGPQ